MLPGKSDPRGGQRAAIGGAVREPARDDPTIPRRTEELGATLLMNAFLLEHLVRLYAAFDGDLLEAIVLGEVAHHNVSGLWNSARSPRELISVLSEHLASERTTMLPTNAFSIAAATGIPRQTVRRKIAKLEAKGWIRRGARGDLFVTNAPRRHFERANRQLRDRFLQVAAAIQLLPGPTAGTTARATSAQKGVHHQSRRD